MWTDQGKTGYHGYWGVNFYKLDEHLPSKDLDFRGLTHGLKSHGLKTVLDIVNNHGSPAYTMPKAQPKYGKIYDGDGKLVADHMNLPPDKLDPKNPLNAFYNRKGGLAQLSTSTRTTRACFRISSARPSNGSGRAPMRCASTRSDGCRTRTGTPSSARSARSIRASSCSARRSISTPTRSPNTPGRRTPA
jgi:hypothetical protein